MGSLGIGAEAPLCVIRCITSNRPIPENSLFVTMPAAEHPMPAGLTMPGHRYWNAVTLSIEHPWFLFQYDVQYPDALVTQTTLVAWEEGLMQVLEAIPAERRRALHLMQQEKGSSEWALRRVRAVWAPGPQDQESGVLLVLQLNGDEICRDIFLEALPTSDGRRPVFVDDAHAGG